MVEVMKIMVASFKRSHAHLLHSVTSTCSRPLPTRPPLETLGHSRIRLGPSFVGSILLSPESWCTQVSVCPLQEFVSPVLCKFWWLYGVVNGDLL